MLVRRLGAVLVVAAVLGLPACTSSGDDAPAPSASSTPATGVASSPPVEITSAADLGRAMAAGVVTISSASLDLDGTGPSGSFGGDGSMTLDAGRVTAVEISGPPSVTSDADRLLITGDAAYVRPEDLYGDTDALWQPVTAANSDPTAVKARGSAAAVFAIADLARLADAYGAATTFREVGVVTGGTRYSVASFAPTAQLGSLTGAEVVPTEGYVDVDTRGRPVRTWTNMTVDGARYAVQVEFGDFDEPVTIEPPAAGEIAD
ncbi:hypothetical protein ACXR2U_20665 [Jatrophihabitans sp. YIM 134969]